MHEPPYRTDNFVIGTIIWWYGSIVTIPSGWHLCNGKMGTPDIVDNFVVGAGDTYDVGDTGGVIQHHHHVKAGTDIAAGSGLRDPGWNFNQIPPYHALCYIMKVN